MTRTPNKALGKSSLGLVMTALDRQIAVQNGGVIGLVVCGGSALAALGLVARTTADADILGRAVKRGTGVRVAPMVSLPSWLESAAKKVARDFGLDPGWLNTGPASQVGSGLPRGLASRLKKVAYGPRLTVYYIGRLDQVHLKLYAAVDGGPGDRHVDDLKALRPTPAEIGRAAGWALRQDPSDGFRRLMYDFLAKHGYGDVAEEL